MATELGEPYNDLLAEAESLLGGETDRIANAANLAALIFQRVPDLNWAGFYFFDGRELVLGPFQGKPACIRIELGQGACGTAAKSRQTVMIDDVHAFPGHIACDIASNAELVVPLVKDGALLGVLDLDSPRTSRFTGVDRNGIEALAQLWTRVSR